MKKRLAILISILLILNIFAGCSRQMEAEAGKSAQTAVTVDNAESVSSAGHTDGGSMNGVKLALLNGMVEVVDFFDDYFQKYNSSNKDGILIQTDYQKEATKVLQVKLAAGTAPDMIVGITPTQSMIDQGAFVDLSDERFWDKLRPSDKEFNTDVKSGRTYGVGLCQTAIGLFYNKAIFHELGLEPANTWDEFVSNLMRIRRERPEITPFYIGGRDSWMLQHMSNFIHGGIAKQKMSYVEQQRAMLYGDLDTLDWDAAPEGTLVTYARKLMELRDSGRMGEQLMQSTTGDGCMGEQSTTSPGLINSNAVKATYSDQIEAFAAGKAAIISQGLWAADLISDKTGDLKNIGFSQYPAMVKGEKPVVGTGTDVVTYILAGSKNIEACKRVLEGMLQPDSMKAISEGRGAPSANPDVYSDWGYLKSDVTSVMNNPSYAVVTWTTMPAWFTGDDEGRMWQDLLVGKYSDPVDFAKAYINAWHMGETK
jgi:raffinose/stachyose/melibiose transport system substrate-binding protein